jgi:hypothetical protein
MAPRYILLDVQTLTAAGEQSRGSAKRLTEVEDVPGKSNVRVGSVRDVELSLNDKLHLVVGVGVGKGVSLLLTVETGGDGLLLVEVAAGGDDGNKKGVSYMLGVLSSIGSDQGRRNEPARRRKPRLGASYTAQKDSRGDEIGKERVVGLGSGDEGH